MFSTVRKRLRDGVELRSPFERLSRPAYTVIATASLAGALLMVFTGFGFDVRLAATVAAWSVSLLIAAWLLRSIGHSRIAGALEAITLVVVQGVVFLFVLYPLAAVSRPYADDLLSRADAAIGFHWAAFAQAWIRHPLLLAAGRYAYASFEWQPLIVVPALAIRRLERRMWTFALSCPLALAVTAAIFFFFPAEGAFRHSGLAGGALPGLSGPASWHFAQVIHQIKDHGARYIDQNMLAGIVAFPSYHTAVAVLYSWAMWPLRFLRWPAVLINAAMAMAAIPFGAHYLVDIIAGVAIGFIAIWLARVVMSWSDKKSGERLDVAQTVDV